MSHYPRDVVDAVRDRTDLVAVVARHVTLQRRGASLVGLCPFHQEKSPSFYVTPSKGIFHCFGCNTGGDVFRFLMQIDGLSFGEAVRELAGPAGVHLEEREVSVEELEAQRKKATLFDVLEAAAQFFESALWTRAEGQGARAYLHSRSITQTTAVAARIGFAPPGWTQLYDTLAGRFEAAMIVDAGLVKVSESGRTYDVLRDRIVFAIRDDRGRVVAFGGRLMAGEGPKYLNTPETRLYQKSKVLYGLDSARTAIQRKDRALIVEGYFDVVSLHQAGFGEAVATCGTALTPDQLERLRRLTRNVVVVFDADEAGLRAAERALPLFVDAGIQPTRLDLPGSKDPDELIRESGGDAFEAALSKRVPLLEWVVDRLLTQHGTGAMGREAVLADVAPWLSRYDDDALVGRVAQRLGLHESVVRSRVRGVTKRGPVEPVPPPPSWRADRDVVHLLWLLVHQREAVADLLEPVLPALLPANDPALDAARRLLAGEPVANVANHPHPEVARTLAAVVARDGLYDATQAATALCHIAARLGAPRRAATLADLTARSTEALADGNTGLFRALAIERERLASVQKRLDAALGQDDYGTAATLLIEATTSRVD